MAEMTPKRAAALFLIDLLDADPYKEQLENILADLGIKWTVTDGRLDQVRLQVGRLTAPILKRLEDLTKDL